MLLSTYAKDGGLYVPEYIPLLDTPTLLKWSKFNLYQIASEILHLFTDIDVETCTTMCKQAFASFNGGQEPSLPLKRVGGKHFLETGNGPTYAFKDIGQQV